MDFGRRHLLAGLGGLFFSTPGVFAEELLKTPKQTEAPSIRTSYRLIPTTT